MLQPIDPIDLTADEQAAVEAVLAERHATGEPDLTAAQLLARMVRKLCLAEWTVALVAQRKAAHLRQLAAAYDRTPVEDRGVLVDQFVQAAPAIDVVAVESAS